MAASMTDFNGTACSRAARRQSSYSGIALRVAWSRPATFTRVVLVKPSFSASKGPSAARMGATPHQTLVIGAADPNAAALLKVPLGTPTAECHCVVTNRKGVAIYVADIGNHRVRRTRPR